MTSEPLKKEPSGYSQMMKALSDETGPIPDGSAQGQAVTWLLKSYTVQECVMVLKQQMQEVKSKGGWRSRVSWLTVKQDIGTYLAKIKKPSDPPPIVQSEDSLTEEEARELYDMLPPSFNYHRRLLEETFGLSRGR